tara:strand:- start:9156 stop:10493 length:1338 start_codon:yes stop_codon:yes gene_type:complete
MTDNHHLEKVLLGKILMNQSIYYDHHGLLSENLFDDALNQKIYKNIETILDKGDTLDLLGARKGIRDSTVDFRLTEAMSLSSEGYLIERIILSLSEVDKKAKIKSLISSTERKLDNEEDLFEVINHLEKGLQPISNVYSDDMPDIKKQVKKLYEDIKMRMDTDGLIGIPSGFASIDKFTGGWQGTDLLIIGGASSMGKTSLGIGFCYNCAKAGVPAAIFSYEMGDTQLLQRIVSIESEVNNRYIMKGTLNVDEFKRVNAAMGKLERLPLYVDETSNSSLRYLINKIRQYSITKGVKFVLVDYLQLVNGVGGSREQEVASVARALKNVAKEMDITIVALSQLSRGVEKRDGNRPTMSDLRESGEIEQAADVVMLAYRPEYYGIMKDEDGNSTEGLADLIVAKGRNIGVGVIPLNFTPEYTKFSDRDTYDNFISNVNPEDVDYEDAF